MFTTEETALADIDFFFNFLVLFLKKIRFLRFKVEEDNPSEKNVAEELDGIGINDIGNLEHLLRIMCIHEECGNLKVFTGGGESTRNINEKKKPGVIQTCRCPLCDKRFMRE